MKTKIALAGFALLSAAALHADDAPSLKSRHANLEGSSPFSTTDGEKLYTTICAACHMPDAAGGTGAGSYPALAKNDKLAASSYPVMMVMNGHGAMPSFRNSMTDAQVAAVVGYVRTHFGNLYADPVPLDDVKQVREAK